MVQQEYNIQEGDCQWDLNPIATLFEKQCKPWKVCEDSAAKDFKARFKIYGPES